MSDDTTSRDAWRVKYDEVPATQNFHNAPRFGHSSDFSKLFSDEKDDQTDYSKGLLFGGILILVFFLTWCTTLLIFKFLREKGVGFLSGAHFRSPANGGSAKRIFRSRVTFLAAGLMFIVFTFLLFAMGITNLEDTQTSIDNANQDVLNILAEMDDIATSLEGLGQSGQVLRSEVSTFLAEPFCPAFPNLKEETGFALENDALSSLDLMNDLEDFIDNDIMDVHEGIVDARKASSNVDDGVNEFELWQALLIVVPFTVLATLMLVGMTLAYFEITVPVYTSLLVWIIVPLFVIATIVAFLACSLSMLAVVANADFCSGGEAEPSPDASVENILNVLSGVDKDDFVYRIARYYSQQCDNRQVEDPWEFLRQYDTDLLNARTSIQDLTAALGNVSVARLNVLCNREFDVFQALLFTVGNTVEAIQQTADKALDVVSCERIVPLYTRTVYTGTCDYSVKGFTWVVSASMGIAFAGMVMLTCRSVLWEVEEAMGPEGPGEMEYLPPIGLEPDYKHKEQDAQNEPEEVEEIVYEEEAITETTVLHANMQ